MLVYRYLSKRELDAFEQGDIDSVGAEYFNKKQDFNNTHKYREGVKYLHFFKNVKDIKHIREVRDDNKEHFLCQFDMPFLTLLMHSGTGYYSSSGYDIDYETVKEYAVPTDDVKAEYLKGYISTKDMSKEEMNGEISLDRLTMPEIPHDLGEDFSQ